MKDREERLRDLDDALEAYLGRERAGAPQDPEEFLDEHTQVRDLLEPLVRPADEVEAALQADRPEGHADVPHECLGDFRLIERIGEGGMGVVYRAQQLSLDRPVALKILPRHLALVPQRLTRFRREASAGGRLRHPGLVAVHAVGEDQGVHYIAQELVPGGRTLADHLHDERRSAHRPDVFYQRTARLFAEIADALAAAHQADVVHRDVKPSNILIDESGRPKVADFGLARLNDVMQLSQTGDFAGSPFYSSPEQAAGERDAIDGRSDVFSLGVTLYEALTHARPFDGDTSQQVLRRVLHDEPLDPRRLHAGVPNDLALICLKCLEKSPARRYATMDALAADLRRYLHDEPILARRPGPIARSWKWTRRHPAKATALGVSLLALTAIGALFARVVQEREQARTSALVADRERVAAERVANFVTRLFEAADPTNARGRTITARELLDEGAASLAADLEDEPAVRARLLYTIGLAYHSLAEHEAAEAALIEAHTLWEREDGPSARTTTLKALSLLASIYQSQDRLQEAEAIYRDLLDRFVDEDSTDLYIDQSNLSSVLRDSGQLEEAEQWALSSLAGMRRHGSRGEVLIAIINSASLQLTRGAIESAEELLAEAVIDFETVFEPDHPMRFHLLSNRGRLRRMQGRYPEALELSQAVLDGRERIFGRLHALTRDALAVHARYHAESGDVARARALQHELVDRNLASIGELHRHTLSSMNTLAVYYKDDGRQREAVEWFERVLAVARELFPPGDPRMGVSLLNLVECYTALGQTERAFAGAAELVDTTPPESALFSEAVRAFETLRDRLGR